MSHHFSGGVRKEIPPVVDMTSHVRVVRVHGPEEEEGLFPNSIKGITQSNVKSFQVFLKIYCLPLSSLQTLTDMTQFTLFLRLREREKKYVLKSEW